MILFYPFLHHKGMAVFGIDALLQQHQITCFCQLRPGIGMVLMVVVGMAWFCFGSNSLVHDKYLLEIIQTGIKNLYLKPRPRPRPRPRPLFCNHGMIESNFLNFNKLFHREFSFCLYKNTSVDDGKCGGFWCEHREHRPQYGIQGTKARYWQSFVHPHFGANYGAIWQEHLCAVGFCVREN